MGWKIDDYNLTWTITCPQCGHAIVKQNNQIDHSPNIVSDAIDKLNYLLQNIIDSDEGVFTFPDGTSMSCRKKVRYVYTKVGD